MSLTITARATLVATVVCVLTLTSASLGTASPHETRSTSNAHPSHRSTTNGRIVFDGADCQIYTVNPDGTALEHTHFSKLCATTPSWSPNGSRIAMAASADNFSTISIYTMSPDGTGRTKLTHDPSGVFDLWPDYTPDGRRLLFDRCRPDPPGGCAIFAMRTDGSHLRQLTHYAPCGCLDSTEHPQVSPDGTRVAFNRFNFRGIAKQVWIMRIDGTHPHPVTRPGLWGFSAHWAPHGHTIYLAGGVPDGFGLQIYKMPANGGAPIQLTHTPWPNGSFSTTVSPTGTRVAFISDRKYHPDTSRNDVFVMNANGSHQRTITDAVNAFDPDWGTAPVLATKSERPSTPTSPQRRLARKMQRLISR